MATKADTTTVDRIEIEIVICMNEDGDFTVGTDESDTATELADNYGGVCMRAVKLKARMAPPQVTEAEVDIPDDAGAISNVEAEAA
jgi:hypothetical protein